ncbi:amino acid adenylation domain-containing protein [Pseudoalteromonas luteoviolacea]|uniref:non-ribosomal peptide synthetase n=1 Tax=Pseudoalteromonas luteoviolacea TaxID=43657 RepID=UPI001F223E94|nr:non-ribosomal peptide synthetase [Pseudoalteromonas luteoviolacea]MCF6437895.1 amino acid adenylation domain-containing protein [Pseudoalteromonas luteoviolacea]
MVTITKNDEKLPLTQGQEDILYDQLHYGDSALYNIGGKIWLKHIDVPRVREAHALLVSQHPMFQLCLHMNGDMLQQSFDNDVSQALPMVDFSHQLSPKESAQHWINVQFQKPFSLTEGSLWRAYLLALGDGEFWYVGIAHHVVNDGFGFSNWVKSLAKFYNGQTASSENVDDWNDLVTKDLSYRSSKRYTADKLFWQDKLEKKVSPLFPDVAKKQSAPKSGRLVVELNSQECAALLEANDAFQDAPHGYFLAALAVYFALFTGQQSIVVGVPTHNRRGAKEKSALALFINVNLLAIDINAEDSFFEVLTQVKQHMSAALKHRLFPVGQVTRAVSKGKSAPYSLGFSYLEVDGGILFGDHEAKYEYETNFSQTLPLNLTVWRVKGEDTQLQFDYNLDYFSEAEMYLLKSRFTDLLKQISENPRKKIEAYSITTQHECALLESWNSTELQDNQYCHFAELVFAEAQKYPERVALESHGQQVTYRQLINRAHALAEHLQIQGVKPGDLIGIHLERGTGIVISQLAILLTGAAFVPLDPSYPAGRLEYMVAHSGLSVVISENSSAWQSQQQTLTIVDYHQVITSLVECAGLRPLNEDFSAFTGLAYVIYTSGSTGKPKGVKVSHRALINFCHAMSQTSPLDNKDNFLAVTPMSFDISIMELLWPLTSGARVTIFEKPLRDGIGEVITLLNASSITRAQLTPSSWKLLLAGGWQGNPELIAYVGGEALSRDLADNLGKKVAVLWNMYGPTEATIWATMANVSHSFDYNCIGQPLANMQAHVLDRHLQTLPVGSFGDLYLSGVGLSEGYLHDDAKSDSAFIDVQGKYYKTGDIARWTTEGKLEFAGRSDRQVKVNGYRIEPEEISTVLKTFSGVDDAVVTTSIIGHEEAVLVAYYTGDESLSVAAVKAHLSAVLPSYMVPAYVQHLTEMPLTPSGKTDIGMLPKLMLNTAASTGGSLQTEGNKTQQSIFAIVSQTIAHSAFSYDDNFFDVGASSNDMLAIRTMVNQTLSVNIDVVDLFQYPTVTKLSTFLASQTSEQESSPRASKRRRPDLDKRRQRRKNINE